MINNIGFLTQVAAIRDDRPTYRLGGDGSDGTCDCIGLIIGAIRRAGGRWNGTHGSNYAARNEMAFLTNELADAVPGWLAYKAKAPGESGYDLPAKYEGGEDLLDYYHVGVVTSVDPLRITHCTSGGGVDGITVDEKQGKWSLFGPCKLIDYGDDAEAPTANTAIVRASSGSKVKMRAKPGVFSTLYWDVPVGSVVRVIQREAAAGWTQIAYGGNTGYMMTKFLEIAESGVADGETVVIELDKASASALMAALRKAGVP